MKNPIIRLLAFLGFASAAYAADVALKEGDCWTYAARPNEEASFLVIRKIEILPKMGEVIHISIFELKIINPSAPHGYSDRAGHLPITGVQVRASLKEKVQRKIPDGDWKEGYGAWREAYDSGKAGVFTKSVSECVGIVEEAFKRANKG